jgi:uncharacterized membrane protein YedE/YeeE
MPTAIAQTPATRMQMRVILLACAALAAGLIWVGWGASARLAALFLVGAGLGFALYHAAFGFTGAWRTAWVSGRSGAVRAQMVMLAVAVAIFFPALEAGSLLGQPVRGFVFPAGWEVALGAFLFGVGMQIGGGCASGTLYTAGGGDTRTAITLVFFVVGMTLGAWDAERWADLPALPAISIPATLGLWPALALNLAVFAAVAWALALRERRVTGAVEPLFRRPGARLLTGPWALAWAGLAGRFAPILRIGLRPLLAAVLGGLMLGYGARMAFGCNISAFFSGVASGSLHGWVWIAAALPGNWLGLKLRPLFGLDVPGRA